MILLSLTDRDMLKA